MKMRIICYSKKKKMEQLCGAIADAQGCGWDKLPLAYPCDKERLTIFAVTAPNDSLARMIPEMDKNRSANVAFLVDGKEGSVSEYIEGAKKAGTNVIDNIKYVKGGLFSAFTGASDEEIADVKAWAEELLSLLK